ncbi:MAG: DUF502 domain-containing protein [Myxococcota bacterium]|nr:DUF502 domain-containing protein [Myxococcota bacterium]
MKFRDPSVEYTIPDPKPKRLWRNYLARVRNYFVAGLLVTVPAVVTIWVFNRFVLSLDGVLHLIPSDWAIQGRGIKEILTAIPGLGAIATLVCVVVVGFLATNFLGRQLVNYTERVIQRVPVISTIYQGVKQLLEAIFTSDSSRFREVVYLQYPRVGVWSLGFVTGTAYDAATEKIGRQCLNVFVPTTPNPTSGFYLLVPEEDVIYSGLSVEQAFKLIMSVGIVAPDLNDGDAGDGGAQADQPGPS